MNIVVPLLHLPPVWPSFFFFIQRLVLPGHRHISLPSSQSTSPDTNTAKRPVTYVDFYICHICPARWPASVHMPAAPPGGLVCSCSPSWTALHTAAVGGWYGHGMHMHMRMLYTPDAFATLAISRIRRLRKHPDPLFTSTIAAENPCEHY